MKGFTTEYKFFTQTEKIALVITNENRALVILHGAANGAMFGLHNHEMMNTYEVREELERIGLADKMVNVVCCYPDKVMHFYGEHFTAANLRILPMLKGYNKPVRLVVDEENKRVNFICE